MCLQGYALQVSSKVRWRKGRRKERWSWRSEKRLSTPSLVPQVSRREKACHIEKTKQSILSPSHWERVTQRAPETTFQGSASACEHSCINIVPQNLKWEVLRGHKTLKRQERRGIGEKALFGVSLMSWTLLSTTGLSSLGMTLLISTKGLIMEFSFLFSISLKIIFKYFLKAIMRFCLLPKTKKEISSCKMGDRRNFIQLS